MLKIKAMASVPVQFFTLSQCLLLYKMTFVVGFGVSRFYRPWFVSSLSIYSCPGGGGRNVCGVLHE